MSRSPRLLVAAAAVVAVVALAGGVLAAVAGDDGDTATVAGPVEAASLDGRWILTATVTDNEIRVAQARASVTIHGDTVTGDDGCGNAVQAELSEGRVAYDGFHTPAGCVEDEANNDAVRFWQVIEEQPKYQIRAGELWLVAESGGALVFTHEDRIPAKPASPVGDWTLEALTADGKPLDLASGQDAWIGIGADGTLTGRSPCNSFGGTVQVLEATLDVEDFASEAMGCERPVMEAESALYEMLSADPTWAVQDGVLRLSGAGIEALLNKTLPGPESACAVEGEATVVVPDVVGLTEAEAVRRLEALDLRVIEGVASTDPSNTVMAHEPPAGTSVVAGACVGLRTEVPTAPVPSAGEELGNGRHVVHVTGVSVEDRTITVDVIEWLTGASADEAYAAETGDTSGAPNDYFVRNTEIDPRTLEIDASFVTVTWKPSGPLEHDIDFVEFPDYLSSRNDPEAPFSITVLDGRVLSITEHYRP